MRAQFNPFTQQQSVFLKRFITEKAHRLSSGYLMFDNLV